MTETHWGRAELRGMVVDVRYVYDSHTFTRQSHTPHISDLEPEAETFHHLPQNAGHISWMNWCDDLWELISQAYAALHLSVQAYIPCVDSSCLVVDAKHNLVDGAGRNALLANDRVA